MQTGNKLKKLKIIDKLVYKNRPRKVLIVTIKFTRMQFAKTPTLNKNILKKIKNLGFFRRRNQPF